MDSYNYGTCNDKVHLILFDDWSIYSMSSSFEIMTLFHLLSWVSLLFWNYNTHVMQQFLDVNWSQVNELICCGSGWQSIACPLSGYFCFVIGEACQSSTIRWIRKSEVINILSWIDKYLIAINRTLILTLHFSNSNVGDRYILGSSKRRITWGHTNFTLIYIDDFG